MATGYPRFHPGVQGADRNEGKEDVPVYVFRSLREVVPHRLSAPHLAASREQAGGTDGPWVPLRRRKGEGVVNGIPGVSPAIPEKPVSEAQTKADMLHIVAEAQAEVAARVENYALKDALRYTKRLVEDIDSLSTEKAQAIQSLEKMTLLCRKLALVVSYDVTKDTDLIEADAIVGLAKARYTK